jgi:hypothetical protein
MKANIEFKNKTKYLVALGGAAVSRTKGSTI